MLKLERFFCGEELSDFILLMWCRSDSAAKMFICCVMRGSFAQNLAPPELWFNETLLKDTIAQCLLTSESLEFLLATAQINRFNKNIWGPSPNFGEIIQILH